MAFKALMLLALFLVAQEGLVQSRKKGLGLGHSLAQHRKKLLADDADIWVLLVAGSNTYMNYRHQADICHAYHIMHKHGIPDDRIVVMMYDDIAYSEENPHQGEVINHPNGTNVYKGILIDYKGEDITPKNFLRILQGDEESMQGIGSGKVIKSGPNDHVFVFFADHGAPGLLAFPSDELMAKDLMNALTSMHKNKQYGKMVLYVEACESGSMFDELLPKNYNIYATTAANPTESSYACYYDDERETYLGDVYSVNWMEDSDVEDLSKETLHGQFKIVKKETNTSHVQEYGDLTMGTLTLSEFQGRKTATREHLPVVPFDAVESPDVPFAVMMKKIAAAKTYDEKVALKKKLIKMERNRKFVDSKMQDIVILATHGSDQAHHLVEKHYDLTDFDCYETVVKHFGDECFQLSKNPYALRVLYILVNLCENNVPVEDIQTAMDQTCTHPPVHDIY